MSDISQRSTTIELDGVEYTFAETHLGDLSALKSHIRSTRLREALEAAQGMSPAERVMMITEMQRQPVGDNEVMAAMETIDGMLFMIWRSLRHNHPDMTLDEVSRLFTANFDRLTEITATIRGMEEDEDAGKKKPAAKKKR